MNSITITEQQSGNYFTFFDNDQGTILHDFVGWEDSDIRVAIDDVSGALGAAYVTARTGKRVFSWQADLVDPDVYQLRRNLASALRLTGVMKLIKFTTYDGLELQIEAEKTKYQHPYTHSLHQMLIEMTAPDFRYYSQELKSFNIQPTGVDGGATIPATIPMAIVPSSTSNIFSSRILVNAGNEVTFPKFTLHGPGHGFTISNVVTGKSFVLSSNLISTDVIIIDTNPLHLTVVKNGTDNLYPDFSGDFWTLDPGENEINFIVGSGLDLTMTLLNILYRDAFAGL